ncbi:Ig-like V-type domain-containing protein FAM187A [Clinocottus analis]|uniref:Ig-like V-type domain-containing protein FAM187A n=1 Tax=Clinocottus analis TaxID=304258 RepID=UPI0035C16ECA
MPPPPPPPPPSSRCLLLLFLLLFLLLGAEVRSYEAPEDKQDVFARKACPAFLTFTNAAYLAGVTVELPCHCKPQQIQSVVWFFRKHLDGSKETRALTDNHGNMLLDPRGVPHSGDLRSRFFIRLFSLLIFRAGTDDSGVYICGSAHKDFFYGYDLDVQEARTLSFGPSVSKKRKASKLGSTGPLYRVFISFRPWSVCDRCGVPGEQVRVGLCHVHSLYLHARYRRANQTVASCGSGAVPRAFGQLQLSGGGGAGLEVRSCQATCQTEAAPSSTLLTLMTFLGYDSGSLPVFYMNHPAGHDLALGCPGARPNMAVAWDKGVEPIYRSEHLAGRDPGAASPRLLIDAGHHLMFQPAKTQDTGVYYCWLQGHRTAEIRLLVYAHFGKRQSVVSHPDFWTALQTVFRAYAAMTAAFCLLLLGRAGVSHLRDARATHED